MVVNGEVGWFNIDGWEVVYFFVFDGLYGNWVWVFDCKLDGICYIGFEDCGVVLSVDGWWIVFFLQENIFFENEVRDFVVGLNGEVYIVS